MTAPQTDPVGSAGLEVADLGGLGTVEIPENLKRTLCVGMVGRKYRLEWFELVDGKSIIEPYDDRLFDGQREANAAHRAIKDAVALSRAGKSS